MSLQVGWGVKQPGRMGIKSFMGRPQGRASYQGLECCNIVGWPVVVHQRLDCHVGQCC